MSSKCEKCSTQFTLQIIDQDTGKTNSTCPNCQNEISFHCHECKEEFLVKTTYQCTWCGYFICTTCHACEYKCEGRTKFKYLIERISYDVPEESILGFKNRNEFIHYQLVGSIAKLNVKRVCPRGVWWTSAKQNIPKLWSILEGHIPKKDQEQYKQRLKKFLEEVFPKITTFNIQDIKENGRIGKEEKDMVEYSICQGWIQLNPKYAVDKKLYIIQQREVCPYFKPPKVIQKGKCYSCKKVYEGISDCPICVYKFGKNKDKPKKLHPLSFKSSGIQTCTCSLNLFVEKKVGEKNWSIKGLDKSG